MISNSGESVLPPNIAGGGVLLSLKATNIKAQGAASLRAEPWDRSFILPGP